VKLYHAFAAGKHAQDRIDFFLADRRAKDELREILFHFGLNNLRQMIKSGEYSFKEAEELCIIASKLLKKPEVDALQKYTEAVMGLDPERFFFEEVAAPISKEVLNKPGLRLAIKEYHHDGLFLALWANPYYDIPVKIGGFVPQEAQFILQNRVEEIDHHFTEFINKAETLDDLLNSNRD
jgi:hypothetical protein